MKNKHNPEHDPLVKEWIGNTNYEIIHISSTKRTRTFLGRAPTTLSLSYYTLLARHTYTKQPLILKFLKIISGTSIETHVILESEYNLTEEPK